MCIPTMTKYLVHFAHVALVFRNITKSKLQDARIVLTFVYLICVWFELDVVGEALPRASSRYRPYSWELYAF